MPNPDLNPLEDWWTDLTNCAWSYMPSCMTEFNLLGPVRLTVYIQLSPPTASEALC